MVEKFLGDHGETIGAHLGAGRTVVVEYWTQPQIGNKRTKSSRWVRPHENAAKVLGKLSMPTGHRLVRIILARVI